MSTKIIIRFDDVSPKMNWELFIYFKKNLEDLGVRTLLGVIPENKDKQFINYNFDEKFFNKIKSYKDFGDTISQHGTFHRYTSKSSGILKINNKSEFAGHSFEYQYKLIKKGKKILEKHNCWQPVFMAPSHSFDNNTIKALVKLGFKSITDGYGLYPYKEKGIYFIPQLFSKPFNIGFGLSTICIHINYLSKKEVDKLINFIKYNRKRIISFERFKDIKTPHPSIIKTLKFLSFASIITMRKIKKLNKI
tara:strand:+ start:126 stop:872 length:747 start_codon:yes stop_codon:yes gene_type:complete